MPVGGETKAPRRHHSDMAHTIPAPRAAQPQAGDPGPRTPTAGPSPSQARAISRAARLCGSPLLAALRRHWPEYVMEGAELVLLLAPGLWLSAVRTQGSSTPPDSGPRTALVTAIEAVGMTVADAEHSGSRQEGVAQ